MLRYVVRALKRASCELLLVSVALNRADCDGGNWNVRQAMSQQVVFRVTSFCINTCFQSFSTLTSRIVGYTTLCWNLAHVATSRCHKPQHAHISTHAPLVACPRRPRSMQIIQQLLFVFFWGNVNNLKYKNNQTTFEFPKWLFTLIKKLSTSSDRWCG